ncbi:MarR family winged helix-turn-helix transcriptional regulator [Ruegeria marina]|uniref:DNA-binding transcriptional regulator, MarR family n=1 Tax=Ruegeria marina TaxID=639004 RepID=A0A1G7DJB2_9RHOB|nr:MarR family winged helix-turn-helix transcriptional regulator [Ruegeria marina]SDE51166.1 DNA-binding transcriptional regulator, MarR family [Ruegeria marina]
MTSLKPQNLEPQQAEFRPIKTLLDALSFRISRLAAINERAGGHYFKSEFDLSLSEWRILGVTAAKRGIQFSELRDLLLLDKGQLSRTIKSLCKRGLINTRKSDSDARQIELQITAAGQVLHDKVLAFTIERNAAMGAVLTDAEWATFDHLLSKLIDHNQSLLVAKGMTDD